MDTKTVPVSVLAQITTTLECITLIDVPVDATDIEIEEAAYAAAKELDGGEFDEIPDSGQWSLYGVKV